MNIRRIAAFLGIMLILAGLNFGCKAPELELAMEVPAPQTVRVGENAVVQVIFRNVPEEGSAIDMTFHGYGAQPGLEAVLPPVSDESAKFKLVWESSNAGILEGDVEFPTVSGPNISEAGLGDRDFNITFYFKTLVAGTTELKLTLTQADGSVIEQKAEVTVVTDAYDYPVKPGTEDWKALGGHPAMIEACQIPDSTLEKMSTAGLVDTVLAYPLFGDVLAYNFIQQGFDGMASRFNGIPELFKRKDAGTALITKYKEMDPSKFDQDWTISQKGDFLFSFYYIEILMGQPEVLATLSEIQHRGLLSEVMAKYQAEQPFPEVYGIISQEINICLKGRIMQSAGYQPFIQMINEDKEIQDYLNTFFPPPYFNIKKYQIINNAAEYLKAN